LVNLGAVVPSLLLVQSFQHDKEETMDKMTLGVDVACRPAHESSLADARATLCGADDSFERRARTSRRCRGHCPTALS
jgi:hypothetical protein